MSNHFVICIKNDDFRASLELRKLYATLIDLDAEAQGLIRVIDESGEDYLYPENMFLPVPLSEEAEKLIGKTLN